ncbi:exonuclease domain-containing protein [Embleya sp. NPDC005971]|uniref:exonuclease domain-containing protein n=1 Tax=Embleya sp. NPDC005971 TaxID=3156724 RepID=UPI0033EF40E6
MSWHLERMAAFDTETTGPNPETARIVSAAIIGVGGGKPTDPATWLVNPGVEIPAEAAAIHGITTERAVAEGMEAKQAVEETATILASYIEDRTPIVAFNARFDLTLLDRECRRHGLVPPTERSLHPPLVIDPYVIDKQLARRKGKRTLTAQCEHYGIVLGDDAHDATADALAGARLAYKLACRYPGNLQVRLKDLHGLQQSWAHDQAVSLQAYFRRTDPDAVVEGAWPLVPYTGGES